MSDAEADPMLPENELETQNSPREDGEEGTPRDTVEENELDEEVDDLFGEGDDEPE
jgi:RNA polymerase-associated protein LEO1